MSYRIVFILAVVVIAIGVVQRDPWKTLGACALAFIFNELGRSTPHD